LSLIFLTNNFALPALTIPDLYRPSLQVGLLFKGIKQHPRVKQLSRTSENTMKTKIRVTESVLLTIQSY
jgi:IS4 transposase